MVNATPTTKEAYVALLKELYTVLMQRRQFTNTLISDYFQARINDKFNKWSLFEEYQNEKDKKLLLVEKIGCVGTDIKEKEKAIDCYKREIESKQSDIENEIIKKCYQFLSVQEEQQSTINKKYLKLYLNKYREKILYNLKKNYKKMLSELETITKKIDSINQCMEVSSSFPGAEEIFKEPEDDLTFHKKSKKTTYIEDNVKDLSQMLSFCVTKSLRDIIAKKLTTLLLKACRDAPLDSSTTYNAEYFFYCYEKEEGKSFSYCTSSGVHPNKPSIWWMEEASRCKEEDTYAILYCFERVIRKAIDYKPPFNEAYSSILDLCIRKDPALLDTYTALYAKRVLRYTKLQKAKQDLCFSSYQLAKIEDLIAKGVNQAYLEISENKDPISQFQVAAYATQPYFLKPSASFDYFPPSTEKSRLACRIQCYLKIISNNNATPIQLAMAYLELGNLYKKEVKNYVKADECYKQALLLNGLPHTLRLLIHTTCVNFYRIYEKDTIARVHEDFIDSFLSEKEEEDPSLIHYFLKTKKDAQADSILGESVVQSIVSITEIMTDLLDTKKISCINDYCPLPFYLSWELNFYDFLRPDYDKICYFKEPIVLASLSTMFSFRLKTQSMPMYLSITYFMGKDYLKKEEYTQAHNFFILVWFLAEEHYCDMKVTPEEVERGVRLSSQKLISLSTVDNDTMSSISLNQLGKKEKKRHLKEAYFWESLVKDPNNFETYLLLLDILDEDHSTKNPIDWRLYYALFHKLCKSLFDPRYSSSIMAFSEIICQRAIKLNKKRDHVATSGSPWEKYAAMDFSCEYQRLFALRTINDMCKISGKDNPYNYDLVRYEIDALRGQCDRLLASEKEAQALAQSLTSAENQSTRHYQSSQVLFSNTPKTPSLATKSEPDKSRKLGGPK